MIIRILPLYDLAIIHEEGAITQDIMKAHTSQPKVIESTQPLL
jgi:hypothetical protein